MEDGSTGNSIGNYRWLVEKDLTYHVPFDSSGIPIPENDMQSLSFHHSYMPVVAEGVYPDTDPANLTLSANICSASGDDCTFDTDCTTNDGDRCVDAHYFISVLPNSGYSIGGAQFKPGEAVTAYVNPHPIPTAQIVVQVCEDKAPINNVCDPGEQPLGGFKIVVEDGGGRYGMSAGVQSYDIWGNPLGTTYLDNVGTVDQLGSGIDTDAEGMAYIKNLAPGKYGIIVVPPPNTSWVQTATIEGKKVIDAWVKANEPPFFAEFGPPGPHVFVSFVEPFNDLTGPSGPNVKGQVVNLHMSRPPEFAMYAGGPFPHTNCWIGINDFSTGVPLEGLYAQPCSDNGFFTIPNVPPGRYQLVVWDDNLDLVFNSMALTVNADGSCNDKNTCNLGPVPTRQWFARIENWVFNDSNQNGIRDCVTETCTSRTASACSVSFQACDTGCDGGYCSYSHESCGGSYAPFCDVDLVDTCEGVALDTCDTATLTCVSDPSTSCTTDDECTVAGSCSFTQTECTLDSQCGGPETCIADPSIDYCTGDELGIPEQAVNLRWRDGTMYQSFATDLTGFVPFDETFPFFSWLVAEVDFARFKATGATFYTDDGGPIDPYNPNSWDSNLKPQFQGNPVDPGMWIHDGYGGDYGDARTEQGVVLTQSFQAFLGQTNVIEWGKAPYGPGENGGISGVVFYSVTRAEDDPRYGGAEPWEPGIPGVTVNLYDATGATLLATTTTDSWDATPPENCQIGSSIPFIYNGTEIDCYDGLRVFNQMRPGVFDGGYAFDEICQGGLDPDGTCTTGTLTSPIPSGRYIVEAEPPAGYQIVRSQDKNVDFGDDYVQSTLLQTPECVGADYIVPTYLSLNTLDGYTALPGAEGQEVPASLAGQTLKTCDRKRVTVFGGNNAAADFFLFTQVPIAAHATGFILDDTANEFDPNSPQFGEKYAPPFLPVSIRDWTGREIGRTFSDAYGRYNFVAPSTWTNSLPQPSGMSPNMLTTCMNDRLRPDGTPDPLHNPQYSQFCYTFQYMPGSTVYLDTPVVPVSAFTGSDQFPLDCEYGDGTPRVYSATNAAGQGPYVIGNDNNASRNNFVIASMGIVDVPNPEYQGVNGPPTVPKNITRDYGFGCPTVPTVTIGGVAMTGLVCGTDGAGRETVRGKVNGTGGQMVVTRNDNGTSSINAVYVQNGLRQGATVRTVPAQFPTIQAAVDAAGINDLILVAPGTYTEMVIMWKPVQLQGWGEGTKIDAVKNPPESLQIWREAVQGLVEGNYPPANPPGYTVTLVPGQEAAFGGVEPAALWTEEGAGILVLARAGDFNVNRNQGARIDGFSISGADTGGGIIVNGFASNMRISNTRVINNSGQYGGGIRLGHPTLIAQGAAACGTGVDLCYPDAQNDNIVIAYNYIGQNGGMNGAGGGVSLCTGSENYRLTNNYICGNFNLEQGGGVAHFGFSASPNNGSNVIARNVIAFNDSFVQTPGFSPSGGGLLITGQPALIGEPLSRGTGRVLVDSNLLIGNAAEAGDGGGISLRQVNGMDVAASPNNSNTWYSVRIVNNMIVNNLSALAGGGISLADAVKVVIQHNTIANNDSTATTGAAFPLGSPTLSTGQLGAGIATRGHSQALLFALGTISGFSNPTLVDNIVWQNRSFRFTGVGTTVDPNLGTSWFGLCPAVGGDAANCDTTVVGNWSGADAYYSDLAVIGTAGSLTCTTCIVTGDPDPVFVSEYATGSRVPTINQPEQQTIFTPAVFDEGGNYIRLRFGPLTRWDTTTGELFGDYHIQGVSSAIDGATTGDPNYDFDGEARPSGQGNQPDPDIGADEYYPAGLEARGPSSGYDVDESLVE